jgi:hypothetical protein
MWMQLRALSSVQEDYLTALGRATALAQNFEGNCKFVFGTYDLGDAFLEGRVDSENWTAYGQKLMSRSLGGALRNREDDDTFKEHVVAFEAARVARNYLAHEAAVPALYVPPMNGRHKLLDFLAKNVDRDKVVQERCEMVIDHVKEALPTFVKAVRDLAEGDTIVCRWSFLIQEKHADIPAMGEQYADDVVKWVLEPLSGIHES